MELIARSLLVIGSLLLLASVRPVWRLIEHLPPGTIRRLWGLLSILLSFFIAGYLAYTYYFWGAHEQSVDLIVPLIFFFGAVFVLLVSCLSLFTSNDIRRIFALEYESTTDPLLGIYNRRYFEKRLHEEFYRARRYAFPLSLVMLDFDDFKSVNELWGEKAGDLVLTQLAELVVTTARESDVVARYTGGQFVLVLPHTRGAAAVSIAERLRRAIESCGLCVGRENDQGAVQVTASLGVATLSATMTSFQQLVAQADKSLYFAKGRGRNMVVACPNTENEKRVEPESLNE